jgi:hypothetical protein
LVHLNDTIFAMGMTFASSVLKVLQNR